ncbi:hypothetical protein LUZ60_006083 [Juncus effusus]|nr:hypothetical protein LUZ60_006083 [Juncus effusus]
MQRTSQTHHLQTMQRTSQTHHLHSTIDNLLSSLSLSARRQTLSSLLSAARRLVSLSAPFLSDTHLANRLLSLFSKLGSVNDARNLFDQLPCKNLCSYNTLISAYSNEGKLDSAVELFNRMDERDHFSWSAVISGYTKHKMPLRALELYRQMFQIYKIPTLLPPKIQTNWGLMATGEERLLLLEEEEEECLHEDAGLYTGDRSVDINGNPILKHNTGNWRACSFILWTEWCERFAYYGISRNLVTFLTTELHQNNVTAARSFTTWQGTCYLTPLVGALLADSVLGRFKTIAVFSAIYLVGMTTLTISTFIPSQNPTPQTPSTFTNLPLTKTLIFSSSTITNPPLTKTLIFSSSTIINPPLTKTLIFFSSLYMIALGAGGIKPCVSSFGADQFDPTDSSERAKKGSFFNWFYFCVNLGSLMAGTVLVWVDESFGWGLGFMVPTFFMGLAIGSFFGGMRVYRFRKPGGSPIVRVFQVMMSAMRKWRVNLGDDDCDDLVLYEVMGKDSEIEGSRKLDHTNQFRFLDKAAIITYDMKSNDLSNRWRICTVTQVEELKLLLNLFPIWATGIIFFTVCAQDSSTFIEQGMVLNKRVGSLTIPPASLATFEVFTMISFLPIYDKIIVPIARNFTGTERGIMVLQRIGTGLVFSTLSMVCAALVESKRLRLAKEMGLVHESVPVPMSILWLVPQYVLVGLSEVFTSIGQIEFFYDQSPDAMRSLCTALALVTVSLGSYLSSAILSLVSYFTTLNGEIGWIPDNLNEGRLDLFFWLLGGLSFVNLVVFLVFAMKYRYKRA